jgi:hypothetical protein
MYKREIERDRETGKRREKKNDRTRSKTKEIGRKNISRFLFPDVGGDDLNERHAFVVCTRRGRVG